MTARDPLEGVSMHQRRVIWYQSTPAARLRLMCVECRTRVSLLGPTCPECQKAKGRKPEWRPR